VKSGFPDSTRHATEFSRSNDDCSAALRQADLRGGHYLFSVSPGCARRLFSDVLTDFVAEVRSLVGDVGPRFFTASRCDQQADPHPDSQSNSFAEYLRVFLPAKRVCGAAQAVRGGIIGVAVLGINLLSGPPNRGLKGTVYPSVDYFPIGWQCLAQRIGFTLG
jgi:hypothetical protein